MSMDLAPLRGILYDILTADEGKNGGDVTATQKMGLELSNSVKKDGVTVVQIQSVVNVQVIKKVTEALRFLDEHQRDLDTVRVLEAEVEEAKALPPPAPNIVEEMLLERASLAAFTEVAQHMYIIQAIERFGNTDAMRLLNIRKNRVEKALEQHGN